MKINSKLPGTGITIFSHMSAMAKEHGAINLSQGFPDFDCSPELLRLANRYINGGFNQYAPMQGCIELRERVSEIILNTHGREYSPDTEITITAGATQGIYSSIAAFVRPGDEVIVIEPAYDSYIPAIKLHGGVPVFTRLRDDDFSIDWKDLRIKVTDKTRAIIINSPHNPTGSLISDTDLEELEKTVKDTDILIISDEVYEHIAFDGNRHNSMARKKSLAERSLIISSFGKTVHTTGWKIGYVAAPRELTEEFRKAHQFQVFVVNHPLQRALADFLGDRQNYLQLKSFYQVKRDRFLSLTAGSPFKPVKSSGTYFQLMSYANFSEEKDTDIAERLTREKKIASIPLSVFYSDKHDNKLLRFCFAKKDETIEKAAEILCSL